MRTTTEFLAGYLHDGYARSLSEFGSPLLLPRSEGFVLVRAIPGCPEKDAMGCYPFFTCRNWNGLREDLEELGNSWVSVAMVTDPFGDFEEPLLDECFPDRRMVFKTHWVARLGAPPETHGTVHHRRNARKALSRLEVDCPADPRVLLDEWVVLYETLIRRHGITGLTEFSRQAFQGQLEVPGMVAFRATERGDTVGILLFYLQGEVAYYHLGAHSRQGYRLGSSFALFRRAIEHFSRLGVGFLNLGSGAGVNEESSDGLTRFKRGWANEERTAYFCGRIFQEDTYARLSTKERTVAVPTYFPAYREGEFGTG